MSSKTIEFLFGSIKKNDFLQHFENDEPVLVHDRKSDLKEIFNLELLESIESLISCWPSQVGAYLPGISDEVNSKKIDKEFALDSFNSGAGLYFDDPNDFTPLLDSWIKGIHKDLGLSNLTYSRSLIYAIKRGFGTSTHFDQNINFVIQVIGEKKWWIAPNEYIKNPLTRYTIGTEPDPELSSYAHHGFPKTMPESATEYILKPGSVLFVPRGSWHKTEASEDAVSLNFTFSVPSWIDLFTSVLRAKLCQSADWRKGADLVNSPEFFLSQTDEFNCLIKDLLPKLKTLSAEEILSFTERGE